MCGVHVSCKDDSDQCFQGRCVCGIRKQPRQPCSFPESNRCKGGMCMCGLKTECVQTSRAPSCRESDGTNAIYPSPTATCQVNIQYMTK